MSEGFQYLFPALPRRLPRHPPNIRNGFPKGMLTVLTDDRQGSALSPSRPRTVPLSTLVNERARGIYGASNESP